MAKCDVCGKRNNTARKHRYRGTYITKRTLRVQKPNVRKLRILESNGAIKRMFVCARCVRSNKIARAI
ncbi:MAG: 50S ribosomal protein L28 [Oscillospiraceae bacterium]|jgi:large subunit ribosomal protein L28|nr:50S ribosomal protein L28 [Oscillospiraceae bacterium]